MLVADQVQEPVNERRAPLVADHLRAQDRVAELTISATNTNAIASSSAISSKRSTPSAAAAPITTIAIRKWMRKFRWVRRTWMIPSNA